MSCKLEDIRLERRGWMNYSITETGDADYQQDFSEDDAPDVYTCMECGEELENFEAVQEHLEANK